MMFIEGTVGDQLLKSIVTSFLVFYLDCLR